MTRHNNDRINDHFAAGVRDLTPASACCAARVLYAPVSPDAEMSRLCSSVLSDSELRRADRFASEHDKIQFKQRRAFRRFCAVTALESSRPLSQISFEETESGRPSSRAALVGLDKNYLAENSETVAGHGRLDVPKVVDGKAQVVIC